MNTVGTLHHYNPDWLADDDLVANFIARSEEFAFLRSELARFLATARHAGMRCVRIVHGKGYRSPGNTPVLRNKVRLSLSQRNEVLAFCDGLPADGGSGAVVVLLKAG